MTIEEKIRDEKLQYDIKREVTKISALSSSKIYRYEYLAVEEILLSSRSRIIEQAKFSCSLLGKALEKQTKDTLKLLKTNTQQLTIKDAILEDQQNEKAKNKNERIKLVNRDDLFCVKNKIGCI